MDNYQQQISINANIRFGKPCIVNTRIAVEEVLSWRASDMSIEEILRTFQKSIKSRFWRLLA